MLKYLEEYPDLYDSLEKSTSALTANLPPCVSVNRVGSMFTAFFTEGPVANYEQAKRSDTTRFGSFFHHLLERGIYFPPSQFEAAFVSAAHTPEDIAYTTNAIAEFFASHAMASRRAPSALRVQVFTVPSGSFSFSAISDCE